MKSRYRSSWITTIHGEQQRALFGGEEV